jgi:uncharacterized protein
MARVYKTWNDFECRLVLKTMNQQTQLQPVQPQPLAHPEENTWGMVCHLAAFGMYVFPAFGNILGALIAWIMFKDRSSFADDQGKESLNFQISLTLYAAIGFAFAFMTLGLGFIVVAPMLGVMAILQIIFIVLAALEANKGVIYRYPATIRFIK